jgi:hypothetical protein
MRSPSFFEKEEKMKLEGKLISHIKFGEGIIKESRDNYITILFSQGEKKFLYPIAFHKYLTLKDKRIQEKIDKELRLQIMQEEESRNATLLIEQKHRKKLQNTRLHPDSQAAFGFVQNSREEVFSSWSVFAGSYQSGSSKGKPKLPVRLKSNSACLLTECPGEELEKSRRIVGVFMPKENFEGSACKDGIIQSHEKYRIKLEDGEMMLFWGYIPADAKSSRWGNIELRYLSDVTIQQILSDMIQVIGDKKRKQEAEMFYEYFCFVNGLEKL